ncbi:hypothetical protein C1T31_12045 [Hanstruepera neustonica]|uniref:Uncharacterized protein n=2 Tax=Hanstruepera neustonica TaxID=1445657 RepID=A0A2K1DWV8_9FLAO|nr:hypothetical protein C1T31_12045 [Hanstruepera neustonica]
MCQCVSICVTVLVLKPLAPTLAACLTPNFMLMATFEKGILGGFSGKVGNVVGARWRGQNIMRSLPQRGDYKPTEDQLLQRERFKTVVTFLTPLRGLLSKYFGKKQGVKSPYNLATAYHLTEALTAIPGGFEIDFTKVLISKGDLRGMETPTLAAAANQVLDLGWADNSGQGNASPLDQLVAVVFAPATQLYQIFEFVGTREETAVQLTLPGFMAGQEVQVWASFVTETGKLAATSTYLGAVTVL